MKDQKEKLNQIGNVITAIVLITVIVVILLSQTGCSVNNAISKNIEEENFILGCKVVKANVGIGYLSQSGDVGVPCKAKCSEELPRDYCFKYDSKTPYGNCNIKIGCQ